MKQLNMKEDFGQLQKGPIKLQPLLEKKICKPNFKLHTNMKYNKNLKQISEYEISLRDLASSNGDFSENEEVIGIKVKKPKYKKSRHSSIGV